MREGGDRVCQEEIKKFAIKEWDLYRSVDYFAGHFGRDKTGAMIVVRWYFPHIFEQLTKIIKYCDA